MDAFKVLEEKIAFLVERISALKQENEKLATKNEKLHNKIQLLEESLLADAKKLDKLDQEKTVTKMVVDDLIKSLDSLIEIEKQ